MKIFIVEDEELAVKKLQKTLHAIDPALEIMGTADSISSTVEWLQSHPQPDLILMDIELADGQSFEIFNLTEVKSPVIFTTSYDEYALKAFKVNSVDYLLKPIQKEELESAIANVENNHDLDVDSLVVAEAYVGKSIVMKRFHARGRGRASRIEKPFSHLTIVVREVEAKGEAA